MLALICAFSAGCVSARKAGDIGQAADMATTVYALEIEDFAEQNPLVDQAGTSGLVAVKLAGNIALIWMSAQVDERTAEKIHWIRAVLGFAAAGVNTWNMIDE